MVETNIEVPQQCKREAISDLEIVEESIILQRTLFLPEYEVSLKGDSMGEERREELEQDIFKENVSTVEDGEVREEELRDSGGSKKSFSEFVNEDETKEQGETREQIQVQERIQVLFCFFTAPERTSDK